MKNKNLLIGLCSVPLLLSISTNMIAQDLRERTYYYEILEPRHEPKPEIKGFATERIKENLDRGLTATPSANGKGIYLSWRLLEQDGTDTSFTSTVLQTARHSVYQKIQLKTPVTLLTRLPFLEKQPIGSVH